MVPEYDQRGLAFSVYRGAEKGHPTVGYLPHPHGLPDAITQQVWSPCIYIEKCEAPKTEKHNPATCAGRHRAEVNFSYADWAVLDFDEGMTLAEARSRFAKHAHIIGITKSHRRKKQGKVCDRFRVCIPFEKRISSVAVFRQNMRRLVEHYGSDNKAKDGARYYSPCLEIVSISAVGMVFQVHPEKKKQKSADYSVRLSRGRLPLHIIQMLGEPIAQEGERNSTQYVLACEMAKHTDLDAHRVREYSKRRVLPGTDTEEREYMSTILSAIRRKRGEEK